MLGYLLSVFVILGGIGGGGNYAFTISPLWADNLTQSYLTGFNQSGNPVGTGITFDGATVNVVWDATGQSQVVETLPTLEQHIPLPALPADAQWVDSSSQSGVAIGFRQLPDGGSTPVVFMAGVEQSLEVLVGDFEGERITLKAVSDSGAIGADMCDDFYGCTAILVVPSTFSSPVPEANLMDILDFVHQLGALTGAYQRQPPLSPSGQRVVCEDGASALNSPYLLHVAVYGPTPISHDRYPNQVPSGRDTVLMAQLGLGNPGLLADYDLFSGTVTRVPEEMCSIPASNVPVTFTFDDVSDLFDAADDTPLASPVTHTTDEKGLAPLPLKLIHSDPLALPTVTHKRVVISWPQPIPQLAASWIEDVQFFDPGAEDQMDSPQFIWDYNDLVNELLNQVQSGGYGGGSDWPSYPPDTGNTGDGGIDFPLFPGG